MGKIRFVIVGSGWRAMYYVRIAKALPERFELCAMLCRTQEKADKIHMEQGIYTTTSKEECCQMKPDFIVVAVNKSSIFEVSKEWLNQGLTVLCETPAALELDDLQEIWRLHTQNGAKLLVAEQYIRYPRYEAMLRILAKDILGEPYHATVSLAHDYHGASLIRAFLRTGMQKFSLTGRRYCIPIVETASRYEQFTDGRISDKYRDRITIEFESGKVAFYDFCSEQYRSPIRNNYVSILGMRGEMKDELFCYLDDENMPHSERLQAEERCVLTGDSNPNLREVKETKMIVFQGVPVYQPVFGLCGLTEDETAIATLLMETARYAQTGQTTYPLQETLQDAYMAILMQKALGRPGEEIRSQLQPWSEV